MLLLRYQKAVHGYMLFQKIKYLETDEGYCKLSSNHVFMRTISLSKQKVLRLVLQAITVSIYIVSRRIVNCALTSRRRLQHTLTRADVMRATCKMQI